MTQYINQKATHSPDHIMTVITITTVGGLLNRW